MATIITDEGKDWIRDKLIGGDDREVFAVAVGDGTLPVGAGQTQLNNELYVAGEDDSTVTIESTGVTGEFTAQIEVSGGTEIQNPPKDIIEFAIFALDPNVDPETATDAQDVMIYREVRSAATTIESGDRKTFEIPITVTE